MTAVALMLASCGAEHVDPTEGAQERMAAAQRALEQEGYEFTFAFHSFGRGPATGTTSALPREGTAAVFAWCEGDDAGPEVAIDDEEIGELPCSEEGEVSEIVADYAYTGTEIHLQGTDARGTMWALAVGLSPEDDGTEVAE